MSTLNHLLDSDSREYPSRTCGSEREIGALVGRKVGTVVGAVGKRVGPVVGLIVGSRVGTRVGIEVLSPASCLSRDELPWACPRPGLDPAATAESRSSTATAEPGEVRR